MPDQRLAQKPRQPAPAQRYQPSTLAGYKRAASSLRAQGLSLSAIGVAIGVDSERVKHLLAQHYHDTRRGDPLDGSHLTSSEQETSA